MRQSKRKLFGSGPCIRIRSFHAILFKEMSRRYLIVYRLRDSGSRVVVFRKAHLIARLAINCAPGKAAVMDADSALLPKDRAPKVPTRPFAARGDSCGPAVSKSHRRAHIPAQRRDRIVGRPAHAPAGRDIRRLNCFGLTHQANDKVAHRKHSRAKRAFFRSTQRFRMQKPRPAKLCQRLRCISHRPRMPRQPDQPRHMRGYRPRLRLAPRPTRIKRRTRNRLKARDLDPPGMRRQHSSCVGSSSVGYTPKVSRRNN